MKYFFLFLAFFISSKAFSQNKKILDSLNNVCKNAKYDTTKVLAMTSIAYEYRNNKADTCIYIAEKALEISKKLNFEKGKANAYYNIGLGNFNKGKYPEALTMYEKSLYIFEKISDEQGIANNLNNIGLIYDNQGNYPLALEYYQKSLKINEKIKNKRVIAINLNNIGSIYDYQGNYPLALEYYQKSLKIREDIDDKRGIANSLNNIGLIYENQGNYPLALEYLQKSLKIKEKIGNKDGISSSLTNIGNIYYHQNNYPLALEYYQKSLKMQEEINDKQNIAMCLSNMGNIYEKQDNYPLALEYLQKSLKIQEEMEDKQGQTYSLNGLAEVAKKQKNYDKSIEYAQKSLQISQEIKTPKEIKNASHILYENYKLKENFIKALEYHELYKTTNDILFSVEKSKKIANLEANVEVERKSKEIEILNKNQELLKKDAQLQRIENEIQKNAKTVLERQADADRLFALARQEKDKRKADSLHNLAQYHQLEADNLKIKEKQLQAENQARKIEALKEKEFQQYINYLIGIVFLFVSVFVYFIYQSRQKEKKAKEEIKKQAEMLEQANQTKDKLFAIIGHDLRNPIGSLESVLNLIKKGVVSYDEFQDLMPKFHKNVKNVQITLENVLQWSISQMQGLTANPTNIFLWQMVEEKIQLFEEIAKAKHITLSMEIPQEITVWADENHLRLLFRNLINNALKFTPKTGKVQVIAKTVGAKVIISVIDNGIGMSEEQMGKLFKKNQTFTTFGTNGEKGTGLGLQLCGEIITENGGQIWVISEQGKSSTFSFSLPILPK